jgi:DNA-binding transcriptional LysR family regulator
MSERRRVRAGEDPVKLGAIDLNLLVVFDAVMREGGVTRAGRGLGLSQPAMSHALARLRHMLKDDLFVRTPKGMVPTPRAQQLAAPIRASLDGLQHALAPTQFDPSTATTGFRIAVDNCSAIVLSGPLTMQVIAQAPRVVLDFRPSATLDIPSLFDVGELDLAIGSVPEAGERFLRRSLARDSFVAILRADHPAGVDEMTAETFAALPHLEISSMQYSLDFIDEALGRRKLTRRVALRAAFLTAVRVLGMSDMVAVMPRRVAEELISFRPFLLRGLPFPSPAIETAMTWPRRLNAQPAHRWLREAVAKANASVR